ncbi:MAG TPA: DUF4352 domain-containing protein [Pyrinomonadaceae bacterium]|jgi:hypothetical protein
MNTNVNLEAALGVLGFLGAGLVLLVAVAVALFALITGRRKLAGVSALAAAGLGGLYLLLMLTFSLASGEKVLARGAEKHFCETDCHLAYSVTDVKRAKTLGDGPHPAAAKGVFEVITLKTRFDEKTISSARGNSPLTPNSRVATILDEQGRTYTPSPEGQRALGQAGAGTPLTTSLNPGESYTTTLVFDLPEDVKNPVLLLNEGEWVTHLIIGHENSPLHKKTMFGLGPAETQASR